MLRNKGVFQKLSLGLSAVFMLMVLSPNAVWAEGTEPCSSEKNALNELYNGSQDEKTKGVGGLKDLENKVAEAQKALNAIKAKAKDVTLPQDVRSKALQGIGDGTDDEGKPLKDVDYVKRLEDAQDALSKLQEEIRKKDEAYKLCVSKSNMGTTAIGKDAKEALKKKKEEAKNAYNTCKKKYKTNSDIQQYCARELEAYRQAEYDACMVEKGGNADKCKKQMNQLAAVTQEEGNEAIKKYNELMQKAANIAVACQNSGDDAGYQEAYAGAQNALANLNKSLLTPAQRSQIEATRAEVEGAYGECEKVKKGAAKVSQQLTADADKKKILQQVEAACKNGDAKETGGKKEGVKVKVPDDNGQEYECSKLDSLREEANTATSSVTGYLDKQEKLEKLKKLCEGKSGEDKVKLDGKEIACEEISNLQTELSNSQDDAQAQAKAILAAQNQAAAEVTAAQDAYNQCLTEKNGDPTQCKSQYDALQAAQEKKAELDAAYDEASQLAGNNDGAGGAGGGKAVKLVDEDVYDAAGTENIFGKVARRAAFVLISLKKIIYLIAGFGLIGFAWMAVFGKISWKWFGNLVISLFLVANVGRFIEYFVYTNPEVQTHEAKVFKDFLLSDVLDGTDPNVAYDASLAKKGYDTSGLTGVDAVDAGSTDGSKNKTTKGFCSGNNGTGWSNFTNCMGDIVSSIKKGADTVKKTANTVNNAINTGKAIVNTAKNIGTAFKNADSFGDVMNAIGTAASGSASIMNMTMNTASNITDNIGDIANNIQDIGKSREEQAELDALRRSGQSTNSIAGAMDAVDGVLDKGKEVTGMASDGLGAIGSASNAVGGLATNIDSAFGITAGKEEKKREKEEQLKNEDNALSGYNQTVAATDKAKQDEKKACEADPNSAACKQATANRELAEAKEKEAKEQAAAAYERQRQAEIEAAKKAKEEAEARQQDACKDPNSVACKQANLDVLKSQEQYDNANNKPKTFDESQEKKQEGRETNAASEPMRAPQYAPQSAPSVASEPARAPQYAPQNAPQSSPVAASTQASQDAPAVAHRTMSRVVPQNTEQTGAPTAAPNSITVKAMAGTTSVAAPTASAEAYNQERQARITAAQNVQQEFQQAYSLAESKSKKLEIVAGNAQKEAETAAAKARQMMDAATRNGNANQYKEAQRLQQEAETKAAEAQKAQAALDEAKQEKEKAEENLKDAKQQEEAAVSAPVYVEYMHQQAADIANNLMARADEAKQAMERAQKLLKSNKSRAAQIAAANAKAAYEEALAKAESAQKKADALKAK